MDMKKYFLKFYSTDSWGIATEIGVHTRGNVVQLRIK